jgi:hypothetical protein
MSMKRILFQLAPLCTLILVSCSFATSPSAPPSTDTPIVEDTAPIPGDLGFGKITGKVTYAATDTPIANATVKCEHFSYTSREEDRCHQTMMTDQNGNFLFDHVFFHDTDTITLTVEVKGYKSFSQKYAEFTQPVLKADIQLSG